MMIANLVANLAFIIKMSVNYYYDVYNLGNAQLNRASNTLTASSRRDGAAFLLRYLLRLEQFFYFTVKIRGDSLRLIEDGIFRFCLGDSGFSRNLTFAY